MATHSSILAWEISWTEEPDGLQSMGLERVVHNLATRHAYTHRATHHCSRDLPELCPAVASEASCSILRDLGHRSPQPAVPVLSSQFPLRH